MIEQNHLDLLLDLNTDENPHSGGDLLDHLRGTHDFLQEWGNDQAVCLGGLFHSIYGTQSYKTESASLEDRQRIREVIGERAERLAFLFSVSIRRNLGNEWIPLFFQEYGQGLDQAKLNVYQRIHEFAGRERYGAGCMYEKRH